MFWNQAIKVFFELYAVLTVNMKCFEIIVHFVFDDMEDWINRKHEMFWNIVISVFFGVKTPINRKHEMFWNVYMKFLLTFIPD